MKNIGEAFVYQFRDKEWVQKFLLGTLVIMSCMFVFPLPLLIGYAIRCVREQMQRKKNLPAWDKLGEMYREGFKFFVVTLGYLLPIFLIVLLMSIIVFAIIILGIIFEDTEIVALLVFVPIMFIMIVYALMAIYGILMNIISPVLYLKMAQREPWRELYNLRSIFKFIKDNAMNVIIVILLNWVCGFIVNIGALFFFIGMFPAIYYVITIISRLYAELYLESKK